MGEVCAEFVRHLTALEGKFEAAVRPLLVIAGTDPRYNRTPFTGRQVVHNLEKMQQTISDILKVEKFEAATAELKQYRKEVKAERTRRRRDKQRSHFFVMPNLQQLMDITFAQPRHHGGEVRAYGATGNPPKRRNPEGRDDHERAEGGRGRGRSRERDRHQHLIGTI
ncbi:unnamed protein product [Heligmosomoides polygyrus]|uniref:V-type proton ATPase subunit a n=1 Tax=Heligmosomoides polygyrus TaxID=6339 RepID=A0A183G597_HELPZ|nr:unnamed protein product [Heligmosomoides polygyrus]